MTDYTAVMAALYPGQRWVVSGDGTIDWYEDGPEPSRDELDAAWPAIRDALAWDEVRVERDRLLAACDWTQVADAPVDAAAWAAYRQALRDIPQDFASADDVVWPEAP